MKPKQTRKLTAAINPLQRVQIFVKLASDNWKIVSAIVFLVGLVYYQINPFYFVQDIAHRQRQERLRTSLIERHMQLGYAFLNIDELEVAKREFEEILKLEPYNADAQFGLLKVGVFQSIEEKSYDPEIAGRMLDQILAESPDDPHALVFQGIVILPRSRSYAQHLFEQAIERNDKLASAFNHLGMMFDGDNNEVKALEMYEKACELAGWNQVYLNNLAAIYVRNGRYDDAVEKYRLILSLDGRFLPAYYDLADVYRRKGDLDGARMVQEGLLSLLEDTAITELARNSTQWTFKVKDKSEVTLASLSDKKRYAYLSVALTNYMIGDLSLAQKFAGLASRQQRSTEARARDAVREIVDTELEHLKKDQTHTQVALEGFWQHVAGTR